MPERFQHGGFGLEVSSGLEELRDQVLAGGVRVIQRVAEDTRAVFEDGRSAWPVKSGNSRGKLGLGLSRAGLVFQGGIDSSSRYVRWIVSGGQHSWTSLIRRPMEARHQQLLRDLPSLMGGIGV